MNRDQYYQGLDPKKLADDPVLVIAIESASYCELYGKRCIRFSPLRERTENFLNEITNGNSRQLGGNFDKLIHRGRDRGFLYIKKVAKKETWIFPNIPAVQKEVNAIRIENLDSSNKRVRIVDNDAKVRVDKSIFEPTVSVSESLRVTVIHANTQESK